MSVQHILYYIAESRLGDLITCTGRSFFLFSFLSLSFRIKVSFLYVTRTHTPESSHSYTFNIRALGTNSKRITVMKNISNLYHSPTLIIKNINNLFFRKTLFLITKVFYSKIYRAQFQHNIYIMVNFRLTVWHIIVLLSTYLNTFFAFQILSKTNIYYTFFRAPTKYIFDTIYQYIYFFN